MKTIVFSCQLGLRQTLAGVSSPLSHFSAGKASRCRPLLAFGEAGKWIR